MIIRRNYKREFVFRNIKNSMFEISSKINNKYHPGLEEKTS